MDINTLANKIKTQLELILDDSGAIVFSSAKTISKGDIYTMGLNPGGGAVIPLRDIIAQLPEKTGNAYINETWENKKKFYEEGKHPLQKNLVGLIKGIGYDPKTVFSTNLIFTRSRGESGANYPENADICWPVHQEFIKIVDPKHFLVFGISGISPFQYMINKYSLKEMDSIESGHGEWRCYWYNGEIEGKERNLIGLPHLSRYYIINNKEVIKWVESIINAERL